MIDRAEHPIQETARNLGPALLVVTFDAIFAFAALHFAKVPMIRDFGLLLAVGIAAICIGSIILPLAILGIREFKSPTKGRDFRAGPLGRLVVWLGSIPLVRAVLFAVASVGDLRRRHRGRGQAHAADRPGAVGQPGQPDHQGHPQGREARGRVERARRLRDEQATCSPTSSRRSRTTSPTDTLAAVPEEAAHRLEHRDGDRRHRQRRARRDRPRADAAIDVAQRLRRRAGRRAGVDRAPTATARSTSSSAPAPARSRRARRSCAASAPTRTRRPGITRHAVGPRRGGRRPARQPRGQPRSSSPTWRSCSCSCSSRSGCAPSSGRCCRWCPVLIAVGVASLVAYAFNLKLSPMTAVGGPLVVAACTEFTSLILLRFVEERRRGLRAAGGGRRRRVAHRTRVRGVRPHRHRRRRGAVVLVAAAAARLRPHRGDERRRRAAQRAGRPAAACWSGPTSATGCRVGSSTSSREPFIPTPPMGGGGDARP